MNLIIVTPIFDDWESFGKLSKELLTEAESNGLNILRIVGVNDCSTESYDPSQFEGMPLTILNLNLNVGHQRAIAIGLSYVNDHFEDFEGCVVMDSDGEDNLAYLPEMCRKLQEENGSKIVFAKRSKRIEGFAFRIFYYFYKLIFRVLTGKSISFGNFSCVPRNLLKRLVSVPELWNHYSGSVIKSKLPYTLISTHRRPRYYGKSKMNFRSLIIHGLSSISLYLDIVGTNILIFSATGIISITLLLLLIVGVRVFTDLAVPGWASSMSLALINFGGLFFVISLLVLMMQLNQRSNLRRPVRNFYQDMIFSVDTFDEKECENKSKSIHWGRAFAL